MSRQTVASIKASDGPGNYCLNVLSSLSLSDKEKLSLVIGETLITFNKHIVCSLSPWIFDILKDECCCFKDHVFISLPDETSLRGFLCLKAVLETGATHELAVNDKDELYVAIKLLGMDIQLETVVQENIDHVASAERHEDLEESVNVVNVSNIDIDEDFIQNETVNDECISVMVGSDAQQHESIVSAEDMFTYNVEVESEQTTIQDANKDLEVLEEINMDNSMENAQRNLNTKPVLKECEVRINHANSAADLKATSSHAHSTSDGETTPRHHAQPSTHGGMGVQPGMPIAQPGTREREVIWKGELIWQEKLKEGPADQKISHSVNCTVSTSKENGVPEVRPDNWPPKLIMQLIPKLLVQTIGGQYFRNSKSVLFHPNECESLDALTKVMGTGFAGCVHFTGVQACDIKVLILLYSNDKKAYLGFIPNDQASFVDRIRTVIQQQKTGQQVTAQGQIGGAQMVGGQQMGVGQQMGGQQHMGQMGGGQMGQMGMQQGQVVTQGQMMGQQGQMMGQQPGMMMGGGNSVMISQGQSMPNMSMGQSIVSTEDMFTYNVEVELEQTTSVVGMDGDDTNNNTTIQPRINNVMEEIQDTNKDLEVLEEINMDNSMENAQRNLNMKPMLKECEVRINRISRTSFGMMRNCCVKIKRLDRKFDKALKYLKCNDTITQELLRETRSNPKQQLLPSQTSRGDVGSCVPQASSSGAPAQRDLHKLIDGNNAQERSHPNVILHSANCDEFFSSIGQAHSTSDGEATPGHAHSTADCQDASNHAHSIDASNHAHSATDLKATPSHAHSTSDGEATPSHHAQPSAHFLSGIKVPHRFNPPQFDGHMSEMDDVNTEEEGIAFAEEINTNRRAFDCIANNAKTVTKTSSSERICLLTELANTDDVNTDGSDLDRDNMEIDTNVTIERSHEDDPMCPTEIIANISSLNEKQKNKIVPKTSSSKSDIMDVIDERAPGDIRICPTKLSNNFSSNEYQRSKTILKMSSSDKIYFHKESLKNSKENVDYGTLDLDFENQERDLFDIIEDRAFKGKQIPSASNVSRNSLPQENHRPVEKEIFMEVDNGDFENGQNIHDGRLTSILPSEFDTEVASVSTPSLLGCSESSKNHVELSNDEEDIEKQIELVPKIKIKRNLIQWAFEFDSDSFLTPPRKTSKRLNVSSDDDIENQTEESPKKTAKTKSKQWKPYSKEEDNNIFRYMKQNNMTGRQRGRRNWQIMEEENVCPGRTWQSMKERWIKHIERKLIKISSGDEDE